MSGRQRYRAPIRCQKPEGCVQYAVQAVVEPDDSDGVSYEDSGFTSVRGAFNRQSTSNSLQIPGEAAVLKVAEPEVRPLLLAPLKKMSFFLVTGF